MMCPADGAMPEHGYRELHKRVQMEVILLDIVAVIDTVSEVFATIRLQNRTILEPQQSNSQADHQRKLL